MLTTFDKIISDLLHLLTHMCKFHMVKLLSKYNYVVEKFINIF